MKMTGIFQCLFKHGKRKWVEEIPSECGTIVMRCAELEAIDDWTRLL